MKFDGQTIANATGGKLIADAPAGPVLTDTRTLPEGAWFLAITGDRFDGHTFMEKAAECGAAGAIISRDVPSWTGGAVLVENTTVAMQRLAAHARQSLAVPVVALTGSAGKTTTRALIALALRSLGPVHQTVGNLNNHWGVPMTLLATPDDAAAVVVEMGTSSPGEIAVLTEITTPDVRLIVNIGHSHSLELGGLEGVAAEKGVLMESAKAGDVLCINIDDPHIAALSRPPGATTVTYGVSPNAEIRLVSATLIPERLATRCVVQTPAGTHEFVLPAPGSHLAHNAVAALAVAYALNADMDDAVAALAEYEPVGMRMRAQTLRNGVVVLNDAYNANPSSMAASLRLLAQLPGRRIAAMGAMLELGDDEAKWHGELAALAGELALDLVVLVGEEMGMAAPCCEGAGEVWVFRDPEDAADALKRWLEPGDYVLVKGSRGAKMERLIDVLEGRN